MVSTRSLHITCTVLCLLWSGACQKRPSAETRFTHADSLTETYLALQDTMLQVWNTMLHDDNRKIRAMHHLLEELAVTSPEKKEDLEHYEERLADLKSMRYDQQSLSDAELISAYDFASNSLVAELISLAEAEPEFAHNKRLQVLADSIRAADQRVNNYRTEYDMVATRFNRFVERNKDALKEINRDSAIEKKPLFQMAAD